MMYDWSDRAGSLGVWGCTALTRDRLVEGMRTKCVVAGRAGVVGTEGGREREGGREEWLAGYILPITLL